MYGGFTNKPKILRGAFVEFGLSIPPLVVVFQFNPNKLTRAHSLSYSVRGESEPLVTPEGKATPNLPVEKKRRHSIEELHRKEDDLSKIRDNQDVSIHEESINFEIRLDATDKLNEGDTITEQFGIAPQLATLELMIAPKGEGLLNQAMDALLGPTKGFSFAESDKPPLILFIWGHKRVLPVNITSMNITETDFSTDLNPIRATVSVSLTVIEGKNPAYTYSKAMREAMSLLNLANITDVANVMIPG